MAQETHALPKLFRLLEGCQNVEKYYSKDLSGNGIFYSYYVFLQTLDGLTA
ncbi:MAG: hypothetical protein P8144_12015 [Gammaproteobacteria bacterium]